MSALEVAPALGLSEIANTDQGCQFTRADSTGTLECQGVRITMDGEARFSNNIFAERLRRSVKYEKVYLRADESEAPD